MPAFTAIGIAVASAVTGATFATVGAALAAGSFAFAAVATITAIGAAYVTSRIINGNPNKGSLSAANQGGRVQVPPATNNRIPVVYGSAYMNGIITDARITNQNNTMFYCIVLSETANDTTAVYTIPEIYWNDMKLQFKADTNSHVAASGVKSVEGTNDFVDNNFDGKVEVRVYAGNSTSTQQIFPTNNKVDAWTYWPDGNWTSANRMEGLVFAIVKVNYDAAKGFTGLPNMTFKVNNSLKNPALVWRDYMTSDRYGANIALADTDSSAITAWEAYCNESITYTPVGGGTATQNRYEINGVIDTNQSVKSNIDSILQNGGAWMTFNVASGKWRPIIKRAATVGELATALRFNDNNIISGITIGSTRLDDLYNIADVEFFDKNIRDQRNYTKIELPDNQRNPNEPDNTLRLGLELTNNNIQAELLANLELKQSRDDLVIEFVTAHQGTQAEAGDVIYVYNSIYDWTEPTYPDGKPFRITRVKEIEREDGALLAEITALEYNAAVYSVATIQEFISAPNLGIKPFNFLPAPTVTIPSGEIDPVAVVPNFDITIALGTGNISADEIRLYVAEATAGSTPAATDYKFFDSYRPNAGQLFTTPITYTTNITGLAANESGKNYFFKARLVKGGLEGDLTTTAAFIQWNPTSVTDAIVATSAAFDPPLISVTTATNGTNPTLPQTARFFLQVGTQKIQASAAADDASMPNDRWRITSVLATNATATHTVSEATDEATITVSALGSQTAGFTDPAYVRVYFKYKNTQGVVTDLGYREIKIAQVRSGANGSRSAEVKLYQYSVNQPAAPSGTSTYTWATGVQSGFSGSGWTIAVPTKPNVVGTRLWTATKTVVDATGSAATSSVDWTTGVSIIALSGTDGITGDKTAQAQLLQWATAVPGNPSGTSTYTFGTTNAVTTYTGGNGWSIPSAVGNPPSADHRLWAATKSFTAAATATDATVDWTSGFTVTPYSGARGNAGANGTQYANIYLYTQSPITPAKPTGTSSYNWTTGSHYSYTGSDGAVWSITAPTNDPGPGVKLWVAQKIITSTAGTQINNYTWTASDQIYIAGSSGTNGTNGTNGADGTKSAIASVYQWSLPPAPSISGTSTYTWSSGQIISSGGGAPAVPTGWSATPGNPPGAGYSLYRADVQLVAAASVTASTINWATATIGIVGYAGTNGAAGSNAKLLTISASSQVFRISKTGTNDPSFIRFTANASNIAPVPTFSVVSGTATLSLGNTAYDRVLNFGNMSTDSVTVRASVTDGGQTYSDDITVIKLREGLDGSTGATGAAGAPAVTAVLSNEAHTIAADVNGNVLGGTNPIDGANTTMRVYIGTNEDTFNWTYTRVNSTGVNSTISSNQVTIQTMTVDNGYVDITANRSGYPSITKRFSLSKSKTGSQGPTGATGATGATGPAGAAGAAGVQARVCYARIPGNPSPVTGVIPVSGDNRPSQSQSANFWSLNYAWSATDPNPSSTHSLFVSDGLYNPNTGITNWNTPYLASLRVGQLSAITVNTGALNVSDTIIVDTQGTIRSGNYSQGSAGWAITNTNAEFNNATFRGLLSAAKIQVGSAATAVDFIDPLQNDIVLTSTVTGFFNYNGVANGNPVVVGEWVYDPKYGWQYIETEIAAGDPVVTGDAVTFTTGPNYTNPVVERRIRTGPIRFLITATAQIDHHFSIWYRVSNGNVPSGGWTHLSYVQERQGGYGAAAVTRAITINVGANQCVQFGFSITDSAGQFWPSDGPKRIEHGSLSVIGVNY